MTDQPETRDIDFHAVMVAHGALTAVVTGTADAETLIAAEFMDLPPAERGRFLADLALAAVLAHAGTLHALGQTGLVDVEEQLASIALELEGQRR
jgi:hypothetical protein